MGPWTTYMDRVYGHFFGLPPKKKLIKEGEMNNKNDVKKHHLTPSKKLTS